MNAALGPGYLAPLLLCVTWTSLSSLVLAGECDNYLVSPDLIRFTEHPKNVSESGSLQCKAQVTPIGGYHITWRSVGGIAYGNKEEWISYQICWEFRSLDNSKVETLCPSEDRVTQNEERSSTIIKLTSTLNTSVTTHNRCSYRCYVEDWGGRLRYYSHSLQDGISANISPRAPNISSTQYINKEGDDDSPTLYCHPDNSSGDFEWFLNGRPLSGRHQETLKANNAGVYACHSSRGNTKFSTMYRVLPFGCLNPVVEYPRLTIPEVQNEKLMEPENLTIVNTTFTSITVTWKPPAISNGEVLSYRIQVVNINAPNSLVTLENTTETTHTVSGLIPSTRYEVIVTAVYAGAGRGPGAHKYVTTEEIDAKPLWIAGGAAISITVALVLVCFCVVHTPKCAKERKVELTLRKDLTLKCTNYWEFNPEIDPDQVTLFEVNATTTYFEADESISKVPYTSEQISDEKYLPSLGDGDSGYVPAPISSPKVTSHSTEEPTTTKGLTTTEGNTLDMDLEVSSLYPSIPASSAGYVPHPSPTLAGYIPHPPPPPHPPH